MTTPNQTLRKVTIGASATVRVWDIPISVPVRYLSIFVSSLGRVVPAGGVDWEVFYGGSWSGGQPFAPGSVLTGGSSQGSGTFAAAAEVADVVQAESPAILPYNLFTRNEALPWGPAYSLELTNNAAAAFEMAVFFVSELMGDYT